MNLECSFFASTAQISKWLHDSCSTLRRLLWLTGFSSAVSVAVIHSHADSDKGSGVDSEQLRWGNGEDEAERGMLPVEPTIEEDEAADPTQTISETPIKTPRKAKLGSYQRLSNLSDEARLSMSSLSISPDKKGTDSNRSSATIKASQINGTRTGATLNDADFEDALKKFASQRDTFLSDLTLSAGAVLPNRPKPRPRTQKIVTEEESRIKSGVGSIRRRISFREMSSTRRQSSVKRQCELPLHRCLSLCTAL